MNVAVFVAASPSISEDWTLSLLGGVDPSALIVLSLGIIAGLYWTWRSVDPTTPLRIRFAISALRLGALLIGLAMLLQPTLSMRSSAFSAARVAVLIDSSGSMRRGVDGQRIETAQRLASELSQQLGRSGVEVEWYCFTDELQAIADAGRAAACQHENRGTDIRGAITGALSVEGKATPLSSVVVISDGADTGISESESLSGWASAMGTAINVVAVTGASARRDIAIASARADRFAFTRTPTSIDVSLAAVGADGETVEVLMLRDGAVVRRGSCEIVDGVGRLTFSFTPIAIGEQVLEVALSPAHQDELPENDRAYVSLSAVRDKYRVLHLAGRPSWDQRFLRSALKDWPKMDLVSFYVLRSELQSESHGSAGMVLIPFPTDELFASHLSEFDVMLIQDLDLVSVGIDRYLPRIAEFVKEGGGLVYLCGPDGLPATAVTSEELRDILPIVPLPPGSSSPAFEAAAFRPQILPDGRRHPLLAFSQVASENQLVWQALPPIEGIARVARLAPGALALAGHPYLFAEDGPSPVFAVRDVGRGRSLAILTPSLWRWGFTGPMTGGPQEAYGGFWHRAISWLTKDASLDRLRLAVSPSPARLGENAVVEVEVLDDAYQPVATTPVEIGLSWTKADKSRGIFEVKQTTDAQGKYRLEWKPTSSGPHQLTVRAGAQGMEAQSQFLVLPSSDELQHLEPRLDLLEILAQASGGSFQKDKADAAALAGMDDSKSKTVSSRDIPLWCHPLAFFLLLSLLSAEWLVRRRNGMW